MPTALIVGASRGLGHAMAAEFLARGWNVVGTVRDPSAHTPLHDLADRLRIEALDINEPAQLAPLRDRLGPLDVLFVNAGTTNNEDTPIGAVPTEDFVDVMVTNALSPMRVIEALGDRPGWAGGAVHHRGDRAAGRRRAAVAAGPAGSGISGPIRRDRAVVTAISAGR